MRSMERTCHTWRTMTMHDIDYDLLLLNVSKMINLLEFDAMRSSGKAKLNSQHLESLYSLEDRYSKMKKKPVKKEG